MNDWTGEAALNVHFLSSYLYSGQEGQVVNCILVS